MGNIDLALLEFHKIREILAGFTSFSTSRQLALRLNPLPDAEEVSLLLKQSTEARHLLSLNPGTNIGEVFDVRKAVKMAARGKVLEPLTLLEIRSTLDAAHRLRSNLMNLSDVIPYLSNLGRSIVELQQLERDISRCLSPSGALLDSASPKLAAVRRRMLKVRQKLNNHLESIIRSPKGQKIIQESIITEREGRYVIPIKVESRREINGIVHDVSNTGATLFIEPWTALDMGNERRELVVEERHEIERILTRLSSEAGAHETEIIGNIDLIARIDLALAKARYAREVDASEPIIVAAGRNTEVEGDGPPGVLRLIDARHPLLGKKAVPLSVEIGRDFSILVITGPNTGGKTVTLKTIGLLSLMVQAGLPITASAESHIPLFDGVFADIGDEQSIEQTLSTFSWHIGNIVRIINNATKKSLVLLDELGTNTDPGEGSALARSILLHFLSERIMTAATTHYTELKAFAHVTDGLQNASLDVNPATMIPTYHLTMGIPGGSNALATASRLGLSPDIITAARDMISQNTLELEDLLTYLAGQRNNVKSLRHSLEKERNEAEQRNAELVGRLRQLEEERRKVIQETRDQVVSEAADLQREVRQAASELRKEKSKERIEQARKILSEVHGQLNTGVWQTEVVAETDEEAAEASPITVGDTVWLREVGLQAKVLSVFEETGLVEVLAGSVKLTVSLDSVEKRMLSTSTTVPEVVQGTRGLSKRRVSLELDLRGKRADEVEPALDSYLDEASLANLGQVRIIHGIGTGTVRQIVRDFVASHPLVSSFRPGGRGEGGNGVTVVRL